MLRWQRDSTWPFFCILGCLLLLGAASLRARERLARTQASGQTLNQPGDDGDQAAGKPDRKPAGGVAEAPQSSPTPQVGHLPPVTSTLRKAPDRMAERRPAEPAGESMGHAGDSDTPHSQVAVAPTLARGIVPQKELFSSSDGGAAAEQELLKTVRASALIHRLPRRSTPLSTEDVPNTGLPPQAPPAPRTRGDGACPARGHPWTQPDDLLEGLDELAAEPATSQWAKPAGRLVRKLGPAVSQGSDEAISILQRLEGLAGRVDPLAATLNDNHLARKLRRAGHALNRRVDIWQQVVQMGDLVSTTAEVPQLDPERLSLCLAEIDAITGDLAEGEAWRKYLLIDALRECSAQSAVGTLGRSPDDRLPRVLAQRVLKRLTQTPMSLRQRQFVFSGPVAALGAELRRWSAEPVDLAGLLAHLEQYEQTGRGSDARLLAKDCLHLCLSSDRDRRRLADRLQAHYRNANLRVAVTEELLDRLMPERAPEYAPVRDTVLGVPVRGNSLTSTDVGIRLLPDPNRVRLALEITGEVASLTSSTSGPATFYNNSESMYTARKPLEVNLTGIRLWPAEVDVYNRTRLRKVRTDFDGVPLIGSLVKQIARSQHEQKRPAVSREVQRKVAFKARQRIDSEAAARLGELSERLGQRFFGPMEVLSLDPTMISAETTDLRFTMRLRLAGEDQLGSHTPRPRAPSGSLASFQVHETALNNVLRRLELDGRTFTLPELARHVVTHLNRPPFWETKPAHEDVKITFAKQDAVGVRLRDGQIVLTLSIVKLSKSPRRWKNFQVRVFYRPQVNGRSAELVRDGIFHLIGPRLDTPARIALSGIFSKTFSEKRPWKLTPERLVTNPKLADLAVTQFVVEDGWIGVALGPRETALRPALRRR